MARGFLSLRIIYVSPKKGKYTLSIEVVGQHGVWSDKSKKTFGSTDNFVIIEDVFIN
jgi:hypothetical protein